MDKKSRKLQVNANTQEFINFDHVFNFMNYLLLILINPNSLKKYKVIFNF